MPERLIAARKRRVRVSFEFTGTDNTSPSGALTFECKLDDRPRAACASPFSTRVKRGKHVFRVWATDEAGNADPTAAIRSFRVVKRR